MMSTKSVIAGKAALSILLSGVVIVATAAVNRVIDYNTRSLTEDFQEMLENRKDRRQEKQDAA